MTVDIAKLRADLRLTAARDSWSDAEIREVGAAIKAAVDADDQEVLSYWATELAWWRQLITDSAPRLRAFEARIKAAGKGNQ